MRRTQPYEAFLKWGTQYLMFCKGKSIYKWMITRGTPISGTPHISEWSLSKDYPEIRGPDDPMAPWPMSSSSTGTTSRPSAQSRRCRTRCMNLPGSQSMAKRFVSKISYPKAGVGSHSDSRVIGMIETLGFQSHKPQMAMGHKVGRTHKTTAGFTSKCCHSGYHPTLGAQS